MSKSPPLDDFAILRDMPAEIIMPTNYLEWRHCIEVQCRQPLTSEYCDQRIASLQNQTDSHTREFIRLYGQTHWQNTLAWFSQASAALARKN